MISHSSSGQQIVDASEMPMLDSSALKRFWTAFKTAINTNDKAKLSSLCEFPFYCRPCIDDSTLKDNNHTTIKVSKDLFLESQYAVFLGNRLKNEVNKFQDFSIPVFTPYFNDKNKHAGFTFSYTLVAPSEKWEGSRGVIYIRKIKGKYKITGIDTVP